ncbi:hypothetical protein ACFL2J_02490 [Candidatus Omnitrophota bacterium]
MLRKLIVGTIVVNFAIMLIGVVVTTNDLLVPSFAATNITAPATANVPEILELASGGIRKIDAAQSSGDNPWSYPNATSFDFGDLIYDSDQGYYTGEFFYTTLMIPISSGRPFKITVTGTSLTGTTGTLPDNAILNIPDYQYADVLYAPDGGQGAMPGDASCATVSSAVGTHDVYTDGGSTGESRIIRGIIAISGPAAGESYPVNYAGGHDGASTVGAKQEFTSWEPITTDDPGGSFSGSITYTLSLIAP